MDVQLPRSLFKLRERDWTAVDVGPGGRVFGASVRAARGASGRPVVVNYAQSSQDAANASDERGEAGSQALVTALTELGRQLRETSFPFTMPLRRGDYQVLVVPEPPVLAAEMESSLRWAVAPMIDYPVQDAKIQYLKFPSMGSQVSAQVYAIVARQALLSEHRALFERCGIPLRAIDVRETALRNIAALLEQQGEVLGLLSADARGITTTFTYGGELCLDRFMELPLEELAAADAVGRERFFDRIAMQLVRSLDLIKRDFANALVERIVIAPMAIPLGLKERLEVSLPVRVEALDLSSILDLSMTPELARPEVAAHYLVAIGAALRGADASS